MPIFRMPFAQGGPAGWNRTGREQVLGRSGASRLNIAAYGPVTGNTE